ncbi:ubiquitin-binding protein cue5 [Acarospora aff. strigata]|nr:ubiquitin-binding protein cue5 [Acarospora aff. strigata]
MSEPEKVTSPVKATPANRPESPTTARELDFDDEPQEVGVGAGGHLANTGEPGEDVAPPKPPRPLSPRQQAENTLREAFPSIDAAVVRAVLTASGGKVEPAFNALLGMSDPDSQKEPTPPPQPPRPVQQPLGTTSTAQSQLQADEQYARQLAEHYSGAGAYGAAPRSGSRGRRDPPLPRRKQETGLKPNELYDDREHSFLDDDLPVIRENIRKGFLETQSTVNKWVTSLKKKIDGEDDEDYPPQPPRPAQGYNAGPPQQSYGIRRSGELGRRSGDRDRYDADPQLIGDDFATLQLRDEEGAQRRSGRPLANPNLFKPTPAAPQSDSRRVSFQDGPPQEIGDLYRSSPDHGTRPLATPGKQSKWQPLSSVDPAPVADADPFSLGDSDDDKDIKIKDAKVDDSGRSDRTPAGAMTDGTATGKKDTADSTR